MVQKRGIIWFDDRDIDARNKMNYVKCLSRRMLQQSISFSQSYVQIQHNGLKFLNQYFRKIFFSISQFLSILHNFDLYKKKISPRHCNLSEKGMANAKCYLCCFRKNVTPLCPMSKEINPSQLLTQLNLTYEVLGTK